MFLRRLYEQLLLFPNLYDHLIKNKFSDSSFWYFFVTFCSVVSWSYKGIFSTNFVNIMRKTSWLQRYSFLLSSELANWFRVAVVPRLKFFLLFVIQFVSNDTCLKLTCFSLGTGALLDRGEVTPALFQKLEKYALIWKKNSLIVVIYG